jgi:ABC-type uncharacterized transport system permease subunit
MTTVFAILALGALLTPVFGCGYARRSGLEATWAGSPWWALLGILCLIVGLGLAARQHGGWPMATVQGGLQTLALVVAVGWVLLRSSERMEAAGIILSSLSALLIVASLVDPPGPVSGTIAGPFFGLHFGLIFLGLGGFAVSFALSALFLLQRRRLKTKKLDGIQELPSMEVLDGLNFRTQGFGFVALTAGIAMGIVLGVERSDSVRLGDLTIWGTGAVWVWYAAGLHGRLLGGWRGRTAAIFGVIGFGAASMIIAIAAMLVGSWHGA